jgi:arylsulfatase A-like enzyme
MEQQQQGIDLSQSFDGSDISRPIFSETDYRLYTHKRSVTMPDGWKYIVTRENDTAELYNHVDDPRELNNLAETQSAKAKELDALLEQHFISTGDIGPWPLGCLAVYGDQCQ